MKMQLPAETTVDAEVDLLRDGEEYWLQAHLSVNIPGVERATAQKIVDAAHQTCPYSKATRGNIDVIIDLV
jgi:Ohr subfamily peroxiredoxin